MAKFYFFERSGYKAQCEVFALLCLTVDDLITIQECSYTFSRKNIDEKIKEINSLSQKEEVVLFMPKHGIYSIKTKNKLLCDAMHRLSIYTYSIESNQYAIYNSMHEIKFMSSTKSFFNLDEFKKPACFARAYNSKKMTTTDILNLKKNLLALAKEYNFNNQIQKVDAINNHSNLPKDLLITGIISLIPVLIYYLIDSESFNWTIAAGLFTTTNLFILMAIAYRHCSHKARLIRKQTQSLDNQKIKNTSELSPDLFIPLVNLADDKDEIQKDSVVPKNYMIALKKYENALTISGLEYIGDEQKIMLDKHIMYWIFNVYYMNLNEDSAENGRVGHTTELAIFIYMIYRYKFICIKDGQLLTTSKQDEKDTICFDMLINSFPSKVNYTGFNLTKYTSELITVSISNWQSDSHSDFGYCIWEKSAKEPAIMDIGSQCYWEKNFLALKRLNLLKQKIEDVYEMRAIKSAQLYHAAIPHTLFQAKFKCVKKITDEIFRNMDWPRNDLNLKK